MARCLVLSARAALAGNVIAGLEAAGHSVGVLTTPEASAHLDVSHTFAAEATPHLRAEPFDPGFLRELQTWCNEDAFDVVLGADYLGTRLAATLATRGVQAAVFPTANLEVLDRVNDKWLFYELLKAARIPCPQTWLLDKASEVGSAPWAYPVIIKPRALGGGILVETVGDAETLYNRAALWPVQQGSILVQDFIPGEDFDVSILAQDGALVAWTIQRWVTDRELEMLPDHPALRTIVAQAVAASRYSGVAHFDLRIDATDGHPRMIECNPRFWATLDASIKQGVNFVDLGVRLALGEDVTAVPHARPGRVRYPGPPGLTAALA